MQRSIKRRLSHIHSTVAVKIALYLASQLDVATVGFFLLNHASMAEYLCHKRDPSSKISKHTFHYLPMLSVRAMHESTNRLKLLAVFQCILSFISYQWNKLGKVHQSLGPTECQILCWAISLLGVKIKSWEVNIFSIQLLLSIWWWN